MADFQQNYDKLEIGTLVSILLNPDSDPEVHKGALNAMTQIDGLHRTSQLIRVLEGIAKYPTRYHEDVMMGVVDALATDPDPYATTAMIEALPAIVESFLSEKPVDSRFREYYYKALLTRQRDEDIEVWGEMLPQLSARTLVAAATDPLATPLDAIEPITLMSRMQEPLRTRTLISALDNMISVEGSSDKITEAVKALRKSHDEKELADGVEVLGEHWEDFRRQGRDHKRKVRMYEQVLKAIDSRPRTAPEKLLGKRPWAP